MNSYLCDFRNIRGFIGSIYICKDIEFDWLILSAVITHLDEFFIIVITMFFTAFSLNKSYSIWTKKYYINIET
jgi:hypothetical protein